ncbi:MAG: DUF6176 family protein [Deinococcota bacterium]
MEQLDIKMYKLKVFKGKEGIANEWLDFLNKNRDEGTKTIKNEKIYLETYFKSTDMDVMYVYLFVAGKDIEYANSVARQSQSLVDVKHFEYMSECIDKDESDVLDSSLYLNNLEGYL